MSLKNNFVFKQAQILSAPVLLSLLFLICQPLSAREMQMVSVELDEGESTDVRWFEAESGSRALLGFPCDEGTGSAETQTAAFLSDSELEVWMPDLLTAHFLPKLKSSLKEIPTNDIGYLINAALAKSNKKLYLIASGPSSALLLRGLAEWEQQNPKQLNRLGGVVLLFPRLNATPPEPGKEPVYVSAVGQTKTSIMVLEGQKTPNSWALPHLKNALKASGSLVETTLIPGVRGYFYDREKPNKEESIVTSQLAGLVKASLIKLDMLNKKRL